MAVDGIDILKLFAGEIPGFNDDYNHRTDEDTGDKYNATFNAHESKKRLRSHEKWNLWLARCLRSGDLYDLMKVRRGLQVGMDQLVKKRMYNDFIGEMFVRWTRSIEKTAKKIINKKHPMPPISDCNYQKELKIKRERANEFELFLKKSSY